MLKDMLGHTVELAGPVRKSVTIPLPASSLFMALDGGNTHLAGMNPRAYQHMKSGILSKIFPRALQTRHDITHSGFAPNVETLLEISPDLIWQWGHMGDDLLTPLHEAGLPVAALLYGDERRTREWVRLMGKALGKPERAQVLLDWRENTEKQIRAITNRLPPQQRPRVLYLSRYRPDYRVAGSESNFNFDVTLAGGVNVASGSRGSGHPINIEQIMAWNPQIILLNNFEADLSPAMIYADPLWRDIQAVQERRVYKIPAGGYFWDPPGQESPLQWQWVSMIVHPARFKWPLRANIAEAYKMLYEYDPSPQDIDAVLHVRMNKASKNYERFRNTAVSR
ncbi:MAG: ABC transporter substrate-binding protein [Zoogloeaceae bacterium]|nr:ABC transporter substrate-binding protein [Zoogloeaceae bacterium]